MSITKEKILKNLEKFKQTGIKYGVVNEELLDMLGDGFMNAPCSTSDKFYNAYDGGLISHILETTKQAVLINEELPENKQVPLENLIRVSLLSQIGKANMFITQDNEWFIKNRGEYFKFNEERLTFKTGEASVFYALSSGIKLSEAEVFAIYNSDIDFTHRDLKTLGEKLASIIKIANLIAIYNQK